MITKNLSIPISWRKGFKAKHSASCRCLRDGKPNERFRMHTWRVLNERDEYVFDEYDPFVLKHGDEFWSEDDPFAEAVLVMDGR